MNNIGIICLILALLLWLVVCGGVTTFHKTDAAGRGLAVAFFVFQTVAAWGLLALPLFMACTRPETPRWAALSALFLHPATCVATIVVIQLIAENKADLWTVVVPGISVPLMTAFILLPRKDSLSFVWGGLLVLALLPLPVKAAHSRSDEVMQAKRRTRYQEEWARYQALPKETPLWERMAFVAEGSSIKEQVWDDLRRLERRQADAEVMVARGQDWPLVQYWRLNLRATPELCAAAQKLVSADAGSEAKYQTAMEWLARNGCALEKPSRQD